MLMRSRLTIMTMMIILNVNRIIQMATKAVTMIVRITMSRQIN